MEGKADNPNSAKVTAAARSQLFLLQGDQLKQAVKMLEGELLEKVLIHQNGVPTFCDDRLFALIKVLQKLDEHLPWEASIARLGSAGAELADALRRLQLFLWQRSQGRFVDFEQRFLPTPQGPRSDSDIGLNEMMMSQGVSDCLKWKGVNLFKTVYDFSVYTMILWNLKPKTIVELGSGMGASAIWMADLMTMFKIEGHIYSVDLKKPELQYGGVSFIQGDCLMISAVFEDEFLKALPHPWLFIEDAHENVYGVLHHFHPYMRQGDYLVVEDSQGKEGDIGKFLKQHPGSYKVDTYYTDFFGRNSTCSHDSIFARL
jgi:cephalosporin hydroxylase